MSETDTHAEIIFPVRTLADFLAADESGEIPAAEPPADERVRLTPEQVERPHEATR